MAKCCMHINKIKDTGAMAASFNHNFRISDVGNADPEKMQRNKVLVALPEGENYIDAYKRKIQESDYYVDHAVRKNAIKELEVMLTYNGRETDPNFDVEAWEQANLEYLKKTFGEDNVVSVVVHYDETTPHIHAVVVPMEDGHLRGKRFFDGRECMRKMQDEYAEAMEPLGLERGRKGSKAKHEDIKEFYSALNSAAEKNLPDVIEGETAEEYRRRAQAIYKKENLRHFGTETKDAGEIASLSGSLEYLERNFKEEKEKLKEKEKELLEKEKMFSAREEEIKKNEALILTMKGIQYGLAKEVLPGEGTNERFGAQVEKLAQMGVDEMIKDGLIIVEENKEK